jgi:hypothetical protein
LDFLDPIGLFLLYTLQLIPLSSRLSTPFSQTTQIITHRPHRLNKTRRML